LSHRLDQGSHDSPGADHRADSTWPRARCAVPAAAAAATADRYQLPGTLRRAYTLARAGPPAVSMTDRQPN